MIKNNHLQTISSWIHSQRDNDKTHSVRMAHGNGLRADIWPQFKSRFGIDKIVDFYAATAKSRRFRNLKTEG